MSKNTTIDQPESAITAEEKHRAHLNRIRREVSARHNISEAMLEDIVFALGSQIARLDLGVENMETRPTGSGFLAVEPEHFRKLENLGLRRFMRDVFIEDFACDAAEHELGLMIQEIKELRAVLLRQFKYSWTEHRKHFPLIAQSEL